MGYGCVLNPSEGINLIVMHNLCQLVSVVSAIRRLRKPGGQGTLERRIELDFRRV